jgi:hypothetical protein
MDKSLKHTEQQGREEHIYIKSPSSFGKTEDLKMKGS